VSKRQDSKNQQPTIRAKLFGSTTCTCVGLTVCADAPVLEMCRKLVQLGLDPKTKLDVFQHGTHSITVGEISPAAELKIAGNGVGFVTKRRRQASPTVIASPLQNFQALGAALHHVTTTAEVRK
jgi:hypothetical protein